MARRRKTPTAKDLLSETNTTHTTKLERKCSGCPETKPHEQFPDPEIAYKETWPALSRDLPIKSTDSLNVRTANFTTCSEVLVGNIPYHKRPTIPSQSEQSWPSLAYRPISAISTPSSTGSSTVTTATAQSLHTTGSTFTSDPPTKLTKRDILKCCNSGKKQASRCAVPRVAAFLPSAINTMLTEKATVLGSIGILPPEIREIVWQNMSYGAAIHLSATNKYYRSAINLDVDVSILEKMRFLRSQEDKSRFNSPRLGKSWFACTGCMEMKPEKRFNVDQIQPRKFRKGGGAWKIRRCLECQLKNNVYRSSASIVNGVGKTMRLCKPCGGFRGGYFCIECSLCETCLGGPSLRCSKCQDPVAVPLETCIEGGRLI